MGNTLENTYGKHIEYMQSSVASALQASGFDSLAIYAGSLEYFWADDMTKSFRATPHLQHWLPLNSEEHILVLRAEQKPLLLYYHPEDYWHEHKPLQKTFWTDHFEIEEHAQTESLQQRAKQLLQQTTETSAWVGPVPNKLNIECETNPKNLVMHLDWFRSFKTDYEIDCLKAASELGVKGHMAAKKSFFAGGSEREIYSAYMQALGDQTALEAPYQPILATDTKGAVLHYHALQYSKPEYSFLIDAGASYHGYASDISRTYVLSPEKNKLFAELIKKMELMQQELCSLVVAGSKVGPMHLKSHELIASLLLEVGLLKGCSVEEAIQEELSSVFYPHGLGHMLGLQVHDVAGKQHSPTEYCPPADPKEGIIYRYLRNQRELQHGCVVTVEPGIYFIETLAKKWREKQDPRIDFGLFDQLKKYGGIRIEDDVVCTDADPINLTRDAFDKHA